MGVAGVQEDRMAVEVELWGNGRWRGVRRRMLMHASSYAPLSQVIAHAGTITVVRLCLVWWRQVRMSEVARRVAVRGPVPRRWHECRRRLRQWLPGPWVRTLKERPVVEGVPAAGLLGGGLLDVGVRMCACLARRRASLGRGEGLSLGWHSQ